MANPSRKTSRGADDRFMAAALRQARRGEGRTSPNPPVGAVLVHGGRVLARGFHACAGEDHAEVDALRKVGFRASGTTLYVTLEPCAHHGRTPPCTEAIISAGVRRVVIGSPDPNPQTDGRGVQALLRAGLEVVVGVRQKECRELVEGFASLVRRGRPLTTLKLAATLDGRIASRTGNSAWVTGELARREVHRLRDRLDAVLVGAGTVRADNPRLTCRLPGPSHRDPVRVVLSGRLDFPADAKVVTRPGPLDGPTAIVATGRRADGDRAQKLRRAGAEVVRLPGRGGRLDLEALLLDLGRRNIATLLIEGGGEVAAGFLEAGLVDRVVWFVAPRIVGGREAVPAVGGRGARRMDQAIALDELAVKRIGSDLMLTGRPRPIASGRSDGPDPQGEPCSPD